MSLPAILMSIAMLHEWFEKLELPRATGFGAAVNGAVPA
jgi:hypothetical protein